MVGLEFPVFNPPDLGYSLCCHNLPMLGSLVHPSVRRIRHTIRNCLRALSFTQTWPASRQSNDVDAFMMRRLVRLLLIAEDS